MFLAFYRFRCLTKQKVLKILSFFLLGTRKRQFAIILADREMVRDIAAKATFFHADATFGVTPGHLRVLQVRSSQVFNLVADYGGATVSVLTVIMSCRKTDMYRKVWSFIKEKFPELDPKTIMCDWEVALRKTAAEAFPDATIAGCLLVFCNLFKFTFLICQVY